MKKTLAAMEPDALFKMWLPASIQSLEQLQKYVWARMTGQSPQSEEKAP
jgi:hypothetical protein